MHIVKLDCTAAQYAQTISGFALVGLCVGRQAMRKTGIDKQPVDMPQPACTLCTLDAQALLSVYMHNSRNVSMHGSRGIVWITFMA